MNKAEERFNQLVAEMCQENDWIIVAKEVTPDHCHLFLHFLPTDFLFDVMASVKGMTSRQLRQKFKHLSQLLSSSMVEQDHSRNDKTRNWKVPSKEEVMTNP